jgi:TatD DNase family protein
MIDTHAHVYDRAFEEDRDQVLTQAFETGIQVIYMPNIDSSSIEGMLALEKAYPGQCLPMMGLHPTSVGATVDSELVLVEDWLNKRSFAAIGEIGLDFYWSTKFTPQQEEVFLIQVRWAKKHGLPIVIHCRNSFERTAQLLEPELDGKLKGIFHCFTGSLEEAQRVIRMGFLLGIGGVVTFKNGGLDKVIPHIGLENLVLETDSPYLAPVPYRGKRNQPVYLRQIAEKLASLTMNTSQEVRDRTTANALSLFKSPVYPAS